MILVIAIYNAGWGERRVCGMESALEREQEKQRPTVTSAHR